MGKVYIGVMAVGGHKLWGGERWKINGRRRGGCGPGMPGPYGGGRVSGCWPEGARVWGGFGPSL